VSSEPQTDALAPGTVLLNTYEILDLVGIGGMGAVYRARHRQLGTLHAVKVIRPELVGSQTARSLFVQEARVLRDLRHEAIVQYDGLFQDESDRVYLVMEFAEGKRLADVLAERGALAEADVWKLYGRLARGLAAAHARGVVHRDLSPDNLILPEGRAESAKIIDFGIAQISEAGARRDAKAEGFAGKFGFAAPEQLGEFGGSVGAPADIYASGLVLAAAALGVPLSMGEDREAAIAARKRVPRLPRSISRSLRGEIQQLLAPDPSKRPPAGELIKRDLIRSQRMAPRPERRFGPLWLGTGALAVGALVAAGLWIGVAGGRLADLAGLFRRTGADPLPQPTVPSVDRNRIALPEPTASAAPVRRATPVVQATRPPSVVHRADGDEGWGPIRRDDAQRIQ
jgi:serine/threonine-protein kinase